MALNELLERRADTGLFARALTLEKGDESRTKAKYIELRAIALEAEEVQEERLRQIEQDKQRVAQQRLHETSKQQRMQDQKLRLAKDVALKKTQKKEEARQRKEMKLAEEREKEAQYQNERELAKKREREAGYYLDRSTDESLSYETFCQEYGDNNPLWGTGIFERRRLYQEWLVAKSRGA